MKLNVKHTVLAALFAALTAVGAFLKIPFPGVPVTLQVFFVFLAGLALPPYAALLSQAAYLVIGLAGVPVFTSGGGIAYALTPTFGYLLSFLAMAPLTSLIARKYLFCGKTAKFAAFSTLLTLGCELIGIGYMAAVLFYLSKQGSGAPLDASKAFYLLYVFLPIDLAKLILSVLLSSAVRKRAPGLFS